MPKPSMPDQSDFRRRQYAFTAHIRDPDRHLRPEDVPERRMRVYRELLYNNMESSLIGCFPVTRKILSQEQWDALVRDFFTRHQCHRHAFREIPQEFIDYLKNEHGEVAGDPPFLRELMHYEWVELALSVDAAEMDFTGIDVNGDLLAGVPVLSPLAWPLSYSFPVHRIDIDFQPDKPGDTPSHLLIYRDRHDDVGFMELNAVTARYLTLLQTQQSTGAEALQQIVDEMKHPNPKVVIDGGREILADLRRRDVVLGTRALNPA